MPYSSISLIAQQGFIPSELRDHLVRSYEGLVFFDDLDEAIVGVVEAKGDDPVVCYDRLAAIELLAERNGWDFDEASEFFDTEVASAYVGSRTPAFLDRFEDMTLLFGGAPSEPPGQ